MKNIFLALLITAFSSTFLKAQNPQFAWAKTFGSAGNDVGEAVWVDNDKNVYVAGNFSGTVDFDPGVGIETLVSQGIKSGFIQKLNANGDLVWVKELKGSGAEITPSDITVDQDGNVIIVGYFKGTIDFDPGEGSELITSWGTGNNSFILKLSVVGDFVWGCRLGSDAQGSSSGSEANAVIIDENKNIYVTGDFNGSIDFDPGVSIVNRTAGSFGSGFILKLDSDKNFFWVNVGGNNTRFVDVSYRNSNLYVIGRGAPALSSILYLVVKKLDVSGGVVWEKRVLGNTPTYGTAIHVDGNDNVITTGLFGGASVDFDPDESVGKVFYMNSNTGDRFILKLAPDGEFLWAKNFYGITQSIVTDKDDNILTSGTFSGIVDFDPSAEVFNLTASPGDAAFTLKLTASGDFVWAGQLGNGGDVAGNMLFVDDNMNIYVTGFFSGIQDLDPGTTTATSTSAGGRDIFIVKLADATTLPVRFISFSGRYENNNAIIQWITSDEINANVFELQKSDDGMHFTQLYSVKAHNRQEKNIYSYVDVKPIAGVNYYRLKQIDFDGNAEFSTVLKIITPQKKSTIFPNPTGNVITINASGKLKDVELINMNGNVVYRTIPASNGRYNISSLVNGIYLLRLNYENYNEIIKLYKNF